MKGTLAFAINSLTVMVICAAISIFGARAFASLRGATVETYQPHTGDLVTRGQSVSTAYELGREGQRVGPTDAAVSMVVFSDYSCGWCAEFTSNLDSALAAYPDHFSYVVRDFVLDTTNPNVLMLHEAAHCAAEQGQFRSFHHAAFASQSESALRNGWREVLKNTATIDTVVAFDCVMSRRFKERVLSSTRLALSLGFSQTPSAVMGEDQFIGSRSFANLDTAIAARLR